MLLRELYYGVRVLNQRRFAPTKKENLQLGFLNRLLSKVTMGNEFYKKYYSEKDYDFHPLDDLTELKSIPIVDKSRILEHHDLFINHQNIENAKVIHSSGTTGARFPVYLDEEAQDYTNCIFTRTLMEQGFNPLRKLGFLWHDKNQSSYSNRFGLTRKAYLHPRSESDDMLSVFRQEGSKYLLIYPFKLFQIACNMKEEDLKGLRLKNIFCWGELLTERMREFLEDRFGCPVTDNYALTECNIAAYRIESSSTYITNDDSVIVELLPDDRFSSADVRRIVVTSLFNTVTPFVRYETGDLAEVNRRGEVVRILGRGEHIGLVGRFENHAILHDMIDIMVDQSDYLDSFSFVLNRRQGESLVRVEIGGLTERSLSREAKISRSLRHALQGRVGVKLSRTKGSLFGERGKMRLFST